MVGWGGIIFKAPAEWNIGTIEKDYLLFYDEKGPAMEVRLGPAGNPFSHQQYLQRIRRGNKNSKDVKLQACPIPPNWQNALRNRDVSGFRWQGETANGQGVIIHEAGSRCVVLIQFYIRRDFSAGALYPHILASICDQGGADMQLWSVFHLRAKISSRFFLHQYHFEVGYQELGFKQKHQTLMLYCWGAASTLLMEDDLNGFAAQRLVLPPAMPVQVRHDDDSISLNWSFSPTGWKGLRRRWLLKRPCFQRVRLWHAVEHNRILAVVVMGNRPFPEDRFESICAHYECV